MSVIEMTAAADQLPAARRIKLFGYTVELEALRAVLVAFLATRLLIVMIIFVSSATIPMRAGPFLYARPDNLGIDGLIRDDSWWYVNIVTHGYNPGSVQGGTQGNVAFFPLYPLLVRMAAGLIGDPYVAGLVVSNVAFLIALAYLYGLARRELGSEGAARAVFYLAAAPTAVFFSAMYTESVYIALICATFFYAQRGAWDRAALAGALAAATRNTGILMVLVIALEAMHQRGVRFWPAPWLGESRGATLRLWRDHLLTQARLALRSWPGLAAAACVPLGLLAYMAYLSNTFGDPLAFIHVQATWGRSASAAGATKLISHTRELLNVGPHFWAGQFNPKTLLEIVATLGFLPLVAAVAFKMRPAHAAYTVLTFLIPLSTGTVGSMTRYILMLIPCFVLLARWGGRPWVDRLVLGVFLPLMGYFAILFSHWYFAG